MRARAARGAVHVMRAVVVGVARRVDDAASSQQTRVETSGPSKQLNASYNATGTRANGPCAQAD